MIGLAAPGTATRLRDRFPLASETAAVYAVIVICVYGWTLLWFFWKLSGWLYYLNAVEMLTILGYSLAVNLLESLLVLCLPIVLSIVLPRRWFGERFVASSIAILLPFLAFMMYAANQFIEREQFRQSHLLRLLIPMAFLAIGLVLAVHRIRPLDRALRALAERATIFLYLSIPVSIAALAAVLLRNLN